MLALVLGALFSFPATSFAKDNKDFLDKFVKAFPKLDLEPEDKFNDSTLQYHEVPMNDPALEYKIRIPKDWVDLSNKTNSTLAINENIPTELAYYKSPPNLGGYRSFLRVLVTKISFQMTAQQWYMQRLLKSGNTMQAFEVDGPYRVESLTMTIDDGVSYIVRTLSVINADKMFQVEYTMPVDNWNDEKAEQEQVVHSFEIVNEQHQIIGDFKKYQFLDVAEISYPSSWEVVSSPAKDINILTAQLVSFGTSKNVGFRRTVRPVLGKIDIDIISSFNDTTIQDELRKFKAKLQEQNLVVADRVEVLDGIDFAKSIDNHYSEVYDVMNASTGSNDFELWYTIMTSGNYYYYIALLTPTREGDFFLWVDNTQTYKLLLQSINPGEVQMDNDPDNNP